MTSEVLMPALSPTMTEGKIARWVKSEGDTVRAGDILAEIETDKATMEVEAVDEGVLAKIVIPEGTDHVAVNTPIALIAENGEDVDEVDAAPPAGRRATLGGGADRPAPRRRTSAPKRRRRPAARAPVQQARAEARPKPTAAPASGPEEYAGKTVTMTVREALRDAMAEEMRRDDTRAAARRGGRPNTRAPTRSARVCCRNSGRAASSTRRSPSTVSPGSGSAPPLPASGRSSSS